MYFGPDEAIFHNKSGPTRWTEKPAKNKKHYGLWLNNLSNTNKTISYNLQASLVPKYYMEYITEN